MVGGSGVLRMTTPRASRSAELRSRTFHFTAVFLVLAGFAAGCSSAPGDKSDHSGEAAAAEDEVAEEGSGATDDLAADELGAGTAKVAPDLTISQKTETPQPSAPFSPSASAPDVAVNGGGEQTFTGTFAEVSVSDIRYVSKKGGGTVVIETSAPATYQVREVPAQSQVVIELANAQLPDRLKRPYITKDFGQYITSINAYQDQGSTTVRVVVQFRAPMRAEVEQIGRELSMRAAEQFNDIETNPTLGAAPPPGQARASQPGRIKDMDEFAEPDEPATAASGASGRDPRILPPLPAERLAGDDLKFYGKPISIEVRDTPVRDVISLIAEQSGTNIVVATDGDQQSTITMKLRQVPWDQALMIVLRSRNLGYVRQGSVLRVAPFESLQKEAESARRVADAQKLAEPLRVKVIPVGYAKVDDLVKHIGAFISKDRGKVVGDGRTNSVIVTDTPDVLERIGNLVKVLDLPPLQVLIEGKVVEARETFSRNIGINWNFNATEIGSGRQSLNAGFNYRTPEASMPGLAGLFNISGTLDSIGDLGATIGLAEAQDQVKVVSSPRVVAMNNEPASIFQGAQLGIPSTTTNGNVTTTQVNYTSLDKMKLEVTPQVTSENDVMMQIDIKREFAGQIKPGAQAPDKNTRQAKTKVLVRNGSTAVIGGIYQSDVDENEDGMPWLKNIPVLGWLFKNKSTNRDKTEMLVFLTPRILNAETSLPKENNL